VSSRPSRSRPARRKTRPNRAAATAVAIGAPLLLAVAACEPDEGQTRPSSPDIDNLRSLPYTGFAAPATTDKGSGVTIHEAGLVQPGLNLFASRPLCRADLITLNGEVVQSWSQPGVFWANCELLPDGDLLIVGAGDGETLYSQMTEEDNFLLRLSWDGQVVWKRDLPVHHDVEVTPRGHIMSLVMKFRRIEQIHPDIDVRDDSIVLLWPDGRPFEECSLYDAFSARPDLFTFQEIKPRERRGRKMVDLFHANSIEWMRHAHLAERHPIYGRDNIILCSRHQDTVAIIDWNSKKLVWAWGQGEISGPHDATVLENGRILLFDNGLGRDWSRVIELDPLTREIVWEYKAADPAEFYTASRGSNQRLANGNTLVAQSDTGRAFEVTREGRIVWEYSNPHRSGVGGPATIVRMKRYEPAYIERIRELHAEEKR